MAEKRSLFKIIFGREQPAPQTTQVMQMLNSSPVFYDFSGDGYNSDVVRSTVDAFARNVGKLKPKHIRRKRNKVEPVGDSNIEWLLQTRPNPLMNAFIFYYRLGTQFLMTNNAFVWIKRNPATNAVEAFYPLTSAGVELHDYKGGIAVKFRFYDGKWYTAPYEDVIHLRRFYFNNDLFGESNFEALSPMLKLISTTDQGIGNAVKQSAFIRGILKFTSMLKPEDMKKQTEAFRDDYLTAANNGGIAATDAKAEYQELKNDPKMIDEKTMKALSSKVQSYFGSNEKIVQSNFSEQEWAAFYESMIEPFAVQMGLEFTSKVFSDRAQGHGNEILFEANRLQYASNDTKIKIIETLVDRGLMNKNEGREIFNMGPIKGGDKYIVSLNYVQADKANKYQLGEDDPGKGGEEENDDGGDT
ncbi:phage portal protein [Cohnella sp. AR92]|uniref:phage portal protein n=1 Tax=Cohnella sp. AR92 TaxID=648716 RepID=UPI000F8D86A3|nr:phage portal protein [Cohnella sp. AR92]RUS47557.1 phage portal protein [Cohnella sp. AR92]